MSQRGAQCRHCLQPLGPQVELLELLEVRDVGKDRRHRRRFLTLLLEDGRAEPDGKLAALRRGDETLATTDLPAGADPAVDSGPQLAGAGLELLEDRLPQE